MRIISKHKDYFDYYQGIFGMDNSKVLKRDNVFRYTASYNPDIGITPTEEMVYDFFICGKQYRILEFKGKLYHTPEEMEKLDTILKKNDIVKNGRRRYKSGGIHLNGWYSERPDRFETQYNLTNGIDTDVNIKQREPVLINRKKTWYSKDVDYSTPLLSDFNFHKILDAKTLYIEVETFLGWLVDNPPLPDKQTNIGKVTGHGFDAKTSFRPKMKTK